MRGAPAVRPKFKTLDDALAAAAECVLALGFAGIHAVPLGLAGWEVVVVEPDPEQLERARQRGAEPVAQAEGRFEAVVAPVGADLTGIDTTKVILVDEHGVASMSP